MAEYALIDGYLGLLRTRLRWRRDVDAVVAEVEDHLYSAAERLEASGTEARLAERAILERFGAPDLVARSFAATETGGLAVPTPSSRTAGTFAILSALLWLVVAAAWWITGWLDFRWEGLDGAPSTIAYVIGVLALLGAGGLMLAAMVGLDRRHGGLGVVGASGSALVGLGVVAVLLAAWIYAGWGLLMAGGTLVFAIAMLGRDVGPKIPTLLFGCGLLVGALTWLALRLSERGVDSCCAMWDDSSWDANVACVTVGTVLLALGLAGLGRWLRSEEPAYLDAPDEPLAA